MKDRLGLLAFFAVIIGGVILGVLVIDAPSGGGDENLDQDPPIAEACEEYERLGSSFHSHDYHRYICNGHS